MIAQNIAHAAVLAGHSVLFRSAAALLEELHRVVDAVDAEIECLDVGGSERQGGR